MSIGASSEILVEEQGPADIIELGGQEVTARSPRQLFWRRFRNDRVAMASATFIILLILVAIFAPLIVKLLGVPGPNVKDPNATDAFGSPLGPTAGHPFGVDGWAVTSPAAYIYGARVSLVVGIFGTAIATFIGTVVGLLAGFYRGWVDTVMSRFVEVFLAFPVLVLGLGIGAACGVRGCAGGLIQPGHRDRDVHHRPSPASPTSPASPEGRCSPCARRSSWRHRARWGRPTGASCSARSCPI